MIPKVSVIIPAYNRAELLERAIAAIEKQNVKNAFECILVFGEDRRVREICEQKAGESKLFSCLHSDTESPARKRNIGIKKAEGSIIAFTDDDCVPDKDWLAEILNCFDSDKTIAGVEGLTYTEGKKELYSNAPVNLKGGLFPTCNLSFRKSVLEKIGGFDESYHFYREDTDLAFMAMDYGKMVFCKKARVLHPQRKVGFMRPIETLGLLKEDIRLYKKLPEKYSKFLGKGFVLDSLKAAASWIVLAAILVGLYSSSMFLFIGGMMAYAIFWLIITKRMQKSAFSFFVFAALNFLRGIALPFYFMYYWVTVK